MCRVPLNAADVRFSGGEKNPGFLNNLVWKRGCSLPLWLSVLGLAQWDCPHMRSIQLSPGRTSIPICRAVASSLRGVRHIRCYDLVGERGREIKARPMQYNNQDMTIVGLSPYFRAILSRRVIDYSLDKMFTFAEKLSLLSRKSCRSKG